MNAKRKIITNRPPISDSEINSMKKPFNELLKEFTMKASISGNGGMSSFMKWGLGSLSTIIVTTAVYFAVIKTGNNETKTTAEVQPVVIEDSTEMINERKIDPPLAEDIPFEEIKLKKNNRNRVVTTKNGTKIHIPKNAFVNANGSEVTDNITIKYRDFYNPVDFFISGIPMDYDSAGTNYTFTSAGMFEIDAKAGDEQLYLKTGKAIDIDMVSNIEEPYNFYYYDSTKNQWEYQYAESKSSISEIEKDGTNTEDTSIQTGFKGWRSDTVAIEVNNQGVQYIISSDAFDNLSEDEKIYRLVDEKKLKVGTTEYYAFAANSSMLAGTEYEGIEDMNLEIKQGQDFDQSYYSVVWDKIFVQGERGDMELVLTKSNNSYTYKVTPVISEKKYTEAKTNYKKQIAEAKEREKVMRKRVKRSQAVEIAVNNWTYSRRVTVFNMGLHNCDHPLPSKPVMAVKGKRKIKDKDGKILHFDNINVVQVGLNTLWRFNADRWYYSNPSNYQNVAWFFTNDKRMAIIFPNNFSEGQLIADIYDSDEGVDVLRSFID
jgi:hypothetical protein